jgi:alpha-ribazole phosphatase/probable phosphoglycerate mutase
MSIDIVYETHSWSEDNDRGIATGWRDGQLSERGRRLAAELGQRRRHDGIVTVFTSDLGRAVETAAIAFAGSGIPVIQDARLRECNYGQWNGMPVARLEAERIRHIDTPYPGGESYRQVVARVAAFLGDLVWDPDGLDGVRVLLIGHTATRWALDHLLASASLEQLVGAPFNWREGWSYTLPSSWTGGGAASADASH